MALCESKIPPSTRWMINGDFQVEAMKNRKLALCESKIPPSPPRSQARQVLIFHRTPGNIFYDRHNSDRKSPWRAWPLGELGGISTLAETTSFS
ncbi:hypothetical protein RCIA164 [Methanocella arvoryzae MRE50]|uniref:Uncharacterized protein n=1 Tax=Methanocella arvoryzae (strain DSM 22066 / NBRC 105507 / MRE50) TaxID=351160 RepID=Q0W2P9_METAR|nr:hypothetical protein RCIA164 [Methanocella arvoryzae MRE50]